MLGDIGPLEKAVPRRRIKPPAAQDFKSTSNLASLFLSGTRYTSWIACFTSLDTLLFQVVRRRAAHEPQQR
jgi:hypothetical protein